jgi:hypothetical protein
LNCALDLTAPSCSWRRPCRNTQCARSANTTDGEQFWQEKKMHRGS